MKYQRFTISSQHLEGGVAKVGRFGLLRLWLCFISTLLCEISCFSPPPSSRERVPLNVSVKPPFVLAIEMSDQGGCL